MAPARKNSMDHLTHPGHPLTPFQSNQDYSCDGCKTFGSGNRYRCHTCDFNLHEYCATCPRSLSSSMHPAHALALVMLRPEDARTLDRICDVCQDPVEGLFYQCKECDFDVHPLCTQLPNSVQHALHKIHALDLQSPGKPGFCAVCRGSCDGWRYRCGACKFDIHYQCVLEPVVPCPEPAAETRQRGIPSQGPTDNGFPVDGPAGMNNPFGPGTGRNPYGPGNFYHNMYNARAYNTNPNPAAAYFGPGNFYHNMYNGQAYNTNPNPAAAYFGPGNFYHNMYNAQAYNTNPNPAAAYFGQQNYSNQYPVNGVPAQAPAPAPANSGKKKSSMFRLVGMLGVGVLSSMIFGADVTTLFAA